MTKQNFQKIKTAAEKIIAGWIYKRTHKTCLQDKNYLLDYYNK